MLQKAVTTVRNKYPKWREEIPYNVSNFDVHQLSSDEKEKAVSEEDATAKKESKESVKKQQVDNKTKATEATKAKEPLAAKQPVAQRNGAADKTSNLSLSESSEGEDMDEEGDDKKSDLKKPLPKKAEKKPGTAFSLCGRWCFLGRIGANSFYYIMWLLFKIHNSEIVKCLFQQFLCLKNEPCWNKEGIL